ncbi:AraC family transcriptional regulator [Herbaspirillum robiniae]|uniref:AraC family transcriptional regulator n=1 Tax=Herbaspirillum robiniae TaxID=2014887 RepID=UPI003D771016
MPPKLTLEEPKAPTLVSFRSASIEGGAVFEPRTQSWGKVGFALTGVMEVTVEDRRFLSPPHYATWIPPNMLHRCHNRHSVKFVSIYLEPSLCGQMPAEACTLELTPLIRAILTDFLTRNIVEPQSEEDIRLALVLIDQLNKAKRRPSYLPMSDDPLVGPITDALVTNPSDRRSLAEWAENLGTTERTVSRRFQSTFGMSFNEWRQRLRLVAALSQIEKGKAVQEISTQLGYSTPSAFIAMFRKLTGSSPTQLSELKG